MKKKYLIIGFIAFLFILLFVAYTLLFIQKKNGSAPISQKISPDILFLSYPIYTFQGTIDKIEGNTLYVSKEATLQQISPSPTSGSAPTAVTKTFKLNITGSTTIFTTSATIPYAFKSTATVQDKTSVTVDALKPGQFITTTTSSDLRTIQSDTFDVNSIEVTTLAYPLAGVIAEISGNTIKVTGHISKSTPTSEEQLKDGVYNVVVSQDTEISQPPVAEGTPAKKLSLSDLAVDQSIIVFSDKEFLTDQNNAALLISYYDYPVPALPSGEPVITSTSPSSTSLP